MAKSNKKFVFNINELVDDDTIYGFSTYNDGYDGLTKSNIRVLNGKRIKKIVNDLDIQKYFRFAKIDNDGYFKNFETYRMRTNGYVSKGKEYDVRLECIFDLIDKRRHSDSLCYLSLANNQYEMFIEWYNDDKTDKNGLSNCWDYIEMTFKELKGLSEYEWFDKDNYYGQTIEDVIKEIKDQFERTETILFSHNDVTESCKKAYYDFKDRMIQKYNLKI